MNKMEILNQVKTLVKENWAILNALDSVFPEDITTFTESGVHFFRIYSTRLNRLASLEIPYTVTANLIQNVAGEEIVRLINIESNDKLLVFFTNDDMSVLHGILSKPAKRLS